MPLKRHPVDHGPQPLMFASIDALTQRWDAVPTALGSSPWRQSPGIMPRYAPWIGRLLVQNVPRLGTLTEDMARLLAGWSGSPQLRTALERVEAGHWLCAGSKEISGHLSRLWAQRQVMERYALRGKANTEMAIAIAKRYQLGHPGYRRGGTGECGAIS